ncbi:hypothetical protein [Streptomyces sp. NPDC101776]|uniref:hypothetical protein n=1 Tax=Streptomyces sp. NPDC101776 TaxID=3366146 RepID=UPI00382B81D4
MADARLAIRYCFDFGDMIRQLREAADRLEDLQNTHASSSTDARPTLDDVPEATPHLVKIDGFLNDADAGTAREALRQMSADPYGIKSGQVVQPYTDHGERKWVFRCWGADKECDGLLSLGHSTESSAEAARERHRAESHPQMAHQTAEGTP